MPNTTDDISSAIKQICEEKALSYDAVITTIESALAAAYRKDYGEKNQNIKVEFSDDISKSKVFDVKTVVEDMPEEEEVEPFDAKAMEGKGKDDDKEEEKKEDKKNKDKKEESSVEESGEEVRKFNPRTEIEITDAKAIKKTAKVGDEIKTKLKIPASYGRMAAQTAKQVIIQKLREAEREMIFNEFKGKEHEVVSGTVQRQEGRMVLVDLGKAAGILPTEEQIRGEFYKPSQRIKVYIKEVRLGARGPEIILSRTSDEILKKVFYLEIPEISNGLVEIQAIAREAGSRSKVAISADSENVDPIGSCVGQKGARIQTIISELGGEKIDMIEYNEDPAKFISNSLAPAKVLNVEINEKEKKAIVKVTEDQLSLAIGKNGQNVRLAARLTGWKIDIAGDAADTPKDVKETPDDKKEKKTADGKPSDTKEQAADDKKEEKSKDEKKDDKKVKEQKKQDDKKEEKDKKNNKGKPSDAKALEGRRQVANDKKEKKSKDENIEEEDDKKVKEKNKDNK